MPDCEAIMNPANIPAKPKEKASDVSLSIAEKLFETPECGIAYCHLPKVRIERKKAKARKNGRKGFDK
jgi:hypothetical protein